MKRRVRIYKAQDGGDGTYLNPMSNFIARAQQGAETQADPQQLVMQVASMVAPPPYGEGQDPNELYRTLAQSYGEEMAAQIINAAAAFVQQQIGDEGQANQQQSAQEENPDLNYQEELLREEQERAEEAYNNSLVEEDEAAFDEMLLSDNPALQEEQTQMKLGGTQKQFVRKALKLAKKALGDTGTQNTSKADSTDILDGRQKTTGDFITTIQNQATLAKVQQQAENIARTAVQPTATFQQMGGFTGQDLFKFVYGGGDDMSIPQLTKAQDGIEIKDITGQSKKVTQEEADLWNQALKDNPNMSIYDLGFASESPVTDDPNYNVWNEMIAKGYGKNLGDYRQGIDYSRISGNMFGQGVAASNLMPTNKIFNKSYTLSGMVNPAELMKQGFTMDKERIGLGHKRYTFTPQGSDRVTAQNKDQFKDDDWSRRDDRRSVREQLGKNYKLGQFLQDKLSADNNRSPKLRNWIDQKRSEKLNVPFLDPKAYGGLPSYQGVNTGSAVNTQTEPIEFKPRSSKEVWAKVEPELRKQYNLPDNSERDIIKDSQTFTIDEKTSFNGENALNTFNPVMRSISKGIEMFGQRDNGRMFNENLDSTNQASAVDNQFRGNYDPNSGLFRQDQMGQLQQSAEGGQRRKTGQQSDWGLSIFPTAMGGSDINQYLGKARPQVQDSLTAVPRDEANLEAEGGETAFGDINGDGFPEHMKIVGPRHSSGGVPLNLPDDTFIFSDTRSMKISDPKILKMFNKPAKKGGYTPAELAKPYDINKYRKILDDPDSDVVDRKTAELMIKNFNVKLGALALAQESKKGFPQGIPAVAQPYMEMMGLKEEDLIPEEENEQAQSFSPSPEEVSMMQQVDETGMPPMDQMAMQQADMSGMPMEGMPMAAYGMSMGGYDMPFAQEGLFVDDMYVNTINEPMVTPEMSNRDKRISQKPYYHVKPHSISNPDPDHYWLTAGDRLRNLRAFITGQEPTALNSGVSYEFQDGGELEQYQTKGEVNYDVKDKNLRPDVENYVNEKGVKIPYTFVDPADEFRYEQENVGEQTKKTGYQVDPESGFYYNPKIGKKPGKAGLEDFYRRHKDFIDYYEGKYGKGKDAWMREQVEAKGKSNPAMSFVVDNLNALHKKLTGKEMVDIKQKGAYIPGVELFNLPGLQLKPKEKEEEIKKVIEEEKEKEKEKTLQEEEDYMPQYAREAPLWLQDQIKMAGAFGDLMSINKYYPWAPKYQPVVPEPVFLDPTRSIAAQSEQAKILGDTMAQFSPSAPLAAGRVSGLQGQLAKGVADTETQYDTANVNIANQFDPLQADIYNKAQMYNQGVSKQLYDANTIMNQQYDNSKRALRNNLLNQYTNAITNRWKTDALNQMYPQFAVDPSVGGQMYYTGQSKKIRPEASKTLPELYREYYEATGDRDAAQKFAMLQYKQNQSGYSSEDMYPAEAMMSLYGNMQKGGSFTFGPGMLPPMIL